MNQNVDQRIATVTSEDLTAVFRSSGRLSPEERLGQLEITPVGTGQMADTVRCILTDPVPSRIPASCVVKLPVGEGQTALTARTAGVYDRELRFYQELLPELSGLQCPEFFGSFLVDGEPALVLEDIRDAVPSNQILGAVGHQPRLAVDQLVNIQARWWNDEAFGAQDWLQRRAGAPIPDRRRRYLAAWDKVKDTVAAELEPGAAEVIEEFGHACDAWSQSYDGPFTLAHHDYRLDNMLFADDRVWLLDWQTLGWGPPSWDLAYFIGSSLSVEQRRSSESELVVRHARQLRDAGIEGWTDEVAWNSYRAMAYSTLLLTMPAAGELRSNERAKRMFTAMWNRTAAMARDLESHEFLTAAKPQESPAC
ncbi:phosphotransferase family protein [Streptomyces sp. NPDC005774]|uniref:phosphotransferase family protein n=1 Tax=Streptomyces sp. NPDC005774 TaxID=3364728 RepID=UPI00367FD2C9